MGGAWIAAVVIVAALGGSGESSSIRPELMGLLQAQEFQTQFELLETLLEKLINGSACRNATQNATEEIRGMESEGEGTTVVPEGEGTTVVPEGEGTTVVPEGEEETEEEEDQECDYEEIHADHTMLLPPNDCKVNSTGITEQEKDLILNMHNELRSKVAMGNESQGDPGPQPPGANMHQLVWNEELAKVAQAWAAQCPNGHDEEQKRRLCSRKYRTGQNIFYYWGVPDDEGPRWENAIENWYNEVKDVDAKIAAAFFPSSTKKIGHYTQFIWGTSKEIGCGIVYYETERRGFNYPNSITHVCNYGPAGNILHQPFYEHGPAASKCPGNVSMEYPALCV